MYRGAGISYFSSKFGVDIDSKFDKMKLSNTARIALFNGLVLMVLSLAEFLGFLRFQLLFSYQWHKLLHLLGVVLFMGNMIVGPVWFLFAYYSKDQVLLRFAVRLLYLTDLYLTIPGIALAVLNGLCLASVFGGTQNLPWLYYSMLLMFLMWALSIPLVFLQEKMFAAIQMDPMEEQNTKHLMNLWGILGTLVTIPPSIIFYLMVVKG